MSQQEKEKLSAQVIMNPASGKRSLSPEQITSENVAEIMPSDEDLKTAKQYFSDEGFEVDAGFANSFSITGDKKLFEKTFETKISKDENQAVKSKGETETSELPAGKLPENVKQVVETITFTEPPDFGPGNF